MSRHIMESILGGYKLVTEHSRAEDVVKDHSASNSHLDYARGEPFTVQALAPQQRQQKTTTVSKTRLTICRN